jgi:D-alanine--poly(phosphoribitol) ligase subunit 2
MDKKTILLDYIKNEFLRNPKASVSEDVDLFSTGIIDSLGVLQLVSYIDEQFNISVPDEDVLYDNFSSIRVLVNYLENQKLGSPPAA